MSLKEAQLIDERIQDFHVVELIGHGAMASVYRAFDTELERDVALKIPSARFAAKANFAKRFGREARAMAMLRHRNIVQIYGLGEYEGIPFLIMEYVDGVSLAKILEERKRIEADEAVEYILAVCKAMECAHRRGIVHRDLKPSNILVESSGRVLVADFGISKIVTSNASEDTLTFAGTPLYMSPEQCGEGTLDQRTDIYSLGVIFYEMIVGRHPFESESPVEIIKSHLMETPQFPRDVQKTLPPKLIRIIRKMLSKNPDQRYTNARVLIQDLELWKHESQEIRASYGKSGNGNEPVVLCYIHQKILRGALMSVMKNIKHQMIAVTSAAELLEKCVSLSPKVVIINQAPGKADVFQLARKIRESKDSSQIKLVLLSYGITREEVETAFRSGINDIIAEPFDPSVLVSKLESVLVGGQRSLESRRFFRKAISDRITMRIESEILDISEGGMRISTNMALKVGEIVRFELQLFRELGFGEKAGKVVWISKNDSHKHFALQAGIDFVNVTTSERERLRKWIFNSEIAGGRRPGRSRKKKNVRTKSK